MYAAYKYNTNFTFRYVCHILENYLCFNRLKHSLTFTATSSFCRRSRTLRLSWYWNKTCRNWKKRTVHDMNPSPFQISFEFQCKLLASDWISIVMDDEVKARYVWFKPLLPFSCPPLIFEAPYVELVPSFSIASAPHVGTEPGTQSQN